MCFSCTACTHVSNMLERTACTQVPLIACLYAKQNTSPCLHSRLLDAECMKGGGYQHLGHNHIFSKTRCMDKWASKEPPPKHHQHSRACSLLLEMCHLHGHNRIKLPDYALAAHVGKTTRQDGSNVDVRPLCTREAMSKASFAPAPYGLH